MAEAAAAPPSAGLLGGVTELTPRRIWLIGSMGSGKTVGGPRPRRSSSAGRSSTTTASCEAHEGRSLTDLAEDGPEALHDREAAQLHRAAAPAAAVRRRVSPPASATGLTDLDAPARRPARWSTCGPRSRRWPPGWGHGDGRPWLDDDPAAWLAATLDRREPAYLAVADVVVDVDDRTPDDVAARSSRDLPLASPRRRGGRPRTTEGNHG